MITRTVATGFSRRRLFELAVSQVDDVGACAFPEPELHPFWYFHGLFWFDRLAAQKRLVS